MARKTLKHASVIRLGLNRDHEEVSFVSLGNFDRDPLARTQHRLGRVRTEHGTILRQIRVDRAMVLFLAALLVARAQTPLDRLAGPWTSLETVTQADGTKGALRLKGENRWIFPGELLEISETYLVDGDPEEGRNHILVRTAPDGKLAMWWYVPKRVEPMVFDGTADDKGMTFTRKDGRLRIVYVWDGQDAYDAKLEVKPADKEGWEARTVARYTRGR